jgi:hypothetical protein
MSIGETGTRDNGSGEKTNVLTTTSYRLGSLHKEKRLKQSDFFDVMNKILNIRTDI